MFCYFLLLWFIVVILLCQDMIYIVWMALTNSVYIRVKVRTCSYHNKQNNYQTLECQLQKQLFCIQIYCSNVVSKNSNIQCSQKVSFCLETGPEFPQNGKNPKLFGTNLFLSEFSILFLVFRFF